VARGVLPFPNVPPGYRQRPDGRLESGPEQTPRRRWSRRSRCAPGGATVAEVRAHLAVGGHAAVYHGVGALLKSRLVLGEIHFGDLVNLKAHEPIVAVGTCGRPCSGQRVSRGRRAKSERLLARLGVLRCGTCGARMIVGTAHHGRYFLYRCPPTGDCPRRVTISADIVEGSRRPGPGAARRCGGPGERGGERPAGGRAARAGAGRAGRRGARVRCGGVSATSRPPLSGWRAAAGA
jgi:hypothetical protein